MNIPVRVCFFLPSYFTKMSKLHFSGVKDKRKREKSCQNFDKGSSFVPPNSSLQLLAKKSLLTQFNKLTQMI